MDVSARNSHGSKHNNPIGCNIYGKTEDYVPLFTIYRPETALIYNLYEGVIGKKSDTLRKQANNYLIRRTHKLHGDTTRIEKIISSKCYDTCDKTGQLYRVPEINFLYTKYREKLINCQNDIHSYLRKSEWCYEVKNDYSYSENSYSNIFKNYKEVNLWKKTDIRSGSYLTNLGFLANIKKDTSRSSVRLHDIDIKTLCCVMVKAEMIPYIKLCALLSEPPHPDALELWVREGFDVTRGEFKNIRPQYRKHVRKEMIKEGIKIVTVPSIDDVMYYKTDSVKFKSITERLKHTEDISDVFLHTQHIGLLLKNNHNLNLQLNE